jgi:23S rRNA pseudouridine1911/1915/1917 synthase
VSICNIDITEEEAGERIDTFLAGKTGITRSQIQKRIEKGDVLVNSKPVSQNYRIKSNDTVSLAEIAEKDEGLIPENIPINIFYQDEALIVVEKPAGMVVYPAAGHSQGTLMNAVAYHCRKLATTGGPLRPGVVHRLDKDTSGVMVVALDDKAYYHLTEQFKQRTINRKYIALVYGNFVQDKGEIALKIGRSATDRKKMSTRVKIGREAVTTWKVLKRFYNATLIQAKLGTGRTHQIRVHFSSIGHPVLGDRTYGKKTEVEKKRSGTIRFPRQMLHAEVLGFIHPKNGEYLEFSSPLPDDMTRSIAALEAML